MRKQTKLVAVLSAAALLAIGASMTSFAAGWQKSDDGTWQYFDRDDEMVSGEWQKDGAKWFYLDDDGNMLTDSWVDDEYYVAEDGSMLVNTWKKTLADEDVADPEDDGENWYYFGSKGKKTSGDSKKIAGKTYYFDTDGKMEDGWHPENNDVYYLGDEDDGARKNGWLWLSKPEDDDNVVCDDNCLVNCDEEGWYYFDSNGKLYTDNAKKKVNGKWYFFNDHGQMLYEWINGSAHTVGSNAQLDGNDGIPVASLGSAQAGNMLYANAVEEGWRADGWYEIDGAQDTKKDSDTDWYYFKDGKAKRSEKATDYVVADVDNVKIYRTREKIAGKYFCFNEYGQMQTGLQIVNDGPTGDPYNTYFFDENGYMKTGKMTNVEEDEDSFTYSFNTKNAKNGAGVTGPSKDGYLYFKGKRLEAKDDYKLYDVNGTVYLVNNKGKLQKSTSKEYTIENENIGGDNLKLVMKSGSTYGIASLSDVSTSTATTVPVYTPGATPVPVSDIAVPEIYIYDNILDNSLGFTLAP